MRISFTALGVLSVILLPASLIFPCVIFPWWETLGSDRSFGFVFISLFIHSFFLPFCLLLARYGQAGFGKGKDNWKGNWKGKDQKLGKGKAREVLILSCSFMGR